MLFHDETLESLTLLAPYHPQRQTKEGVPQEIKLLGTDDKDPVLVVTSKAFRYSDPESFIENAG